MLHTSLAMICSILMSTERLYRKNAIIATKKVLPRRGRTNTLRTLEMLKRDCESHLKHQKFLVRQPIHYHCQYEFYNRCIRADGGNDMQYFYCPLYQLYHRLFTSFRYGQRESLHPHPTMGYLACKVFYHRDFLQTHFFCACGIWHFMIIFHSILFFRR